MKYLIVPIADEHIAGFNAAVGNVAQEQRFLTFLDTPPLAQSDAFVRQLREARFPQYVALSDQQVVGWCDIAPMNRPVFKHAGLLGVGRFAEFRGKRTGTALMRPTTPRS